MSDLDINDPNWRHPDVVRQEVYQEEFRSCFPHLAEYAPSVSYALSPYGLDVLESLSKVRAKFDLGKFVSHIQGSNKKFYPWQYAVADLIYGEGALLAWRIDKQRSIIETFRTNLAGAEAKLQNLTEGGTPA